jgi:hypothetical protein
MLLVPSQIAKKRYWVNPVILLPNECECSSPNIKRRHDKSANTAPHGTRQALSKHAA